MAVKCKCFEHTTSLFLFEGIPELFEKQFDKTSENVKGNKEHIFASTRARANIWTDQSQSDLEERPFWAMAAMSTDPGKGQLLKLKREIFCVLWQIANLKDVKKSAIPTSLYKRRHFRGGPHLRRGRIQPEQHTCQFSRLFLTRSKINQASPLKIRI